MPFWSLIDYKALHGRDTWFFHTFHFLPSVVDRMIPRPRRCPQPNPRNLWRRYLPRPRDTVGTGCGSPAPASPGERDTQADHTEVPAHVAKAGNGWAPHGVGPTGHKSLWKTRTTITLLPPGKFTWGRSERVWTGRGRRQRRQRPQIRDGRTRMSDRHGVEWREGVESTVVDTVHSSRTCRGWLRASSCR